ncbi:hypothetical protein SGRA_2366 [Saprospira grandis str. Lewin]|uniref:Uncharacterized protein n=1 Tax=Saprospira grandis (strain Lewin) TaxID=984262 RepID=H6L4S0_SAPGL|nr:hypothetical protein SGRA_2366 [Saprospira grandis str. Lewin]
MQKLKNNRLPDLSSGLKILILLVLFWSFCFGAAHSLRSGRAVSQLAVRPALRAAQHSGGQLAGRGPQKNIACLLMKTGDE